MSKELHVIKKFEVNEEAQAQIRFVRDIFLQVKSFKGTANRCNELGLKSPKGKKMVASTVTRFLTDEVYHGKYTRNKRGIKNKKIYYKDESLHVINEVPKVFSDDEWEEIQKLVASIRRADNNFVKKFTNAFSGLIFDDLCKNKMYSKKETDRYICKECGRRIPQEILDNAVLKVLSEVVLVPESMTEFYNEYKQKNVSYKTLMDNEIITIKKRLSEINDNNEKLIDKLLESGQFEPKAIKRKLIELEQEEEALKSKLADKIYEHKKTFQTQDKAYDELTKSPQKIMDVYNNLDVKKKNELLKCFINKIAVAEDKVTISMYFIPEFINSFFLAVG